jgi:hypothetical protein
MQRLAPLALMLGIPKAQRIGLNQSTNFIAFVLTESSKARSTFQNVLLQQSGLS